MVKFLSILVQTPDYESQLKERMVASEMSNILLVLVQTPDYESQLKERTVASEMSKTLVYIGFGSDS
jgi:hypothetical protein